LDNGKDIWPVKILHCLTWNDLCFSIGSSIHRYDLQAEPYTPQP